MWRHFNTDGFCNPQEHYMENLNDRLFQIRNKYAVPDSYFVINRGRQFGKTTILKALPENLKSDYITLFMDFQNITTKNFENGTRFARFFAKRLISAFIEAGIEDQERLLNPPMDFAQDKESNEPRRELQRQ